MNPDWAGRIAGMTRDGKSAPEIAAALNICARTVQRYRAALGIGQERAPIRDESERLRAKALLDEGAPYAEAARTLGVHPQTVARWWPGYAWTRSQCGKHSAFVRREVRKVLS